MRVVFTPVTRLTGKLKRWFRCLAMRDENANISYQAIINLAFRLMLFESVEIALKMDLMRC